MKGPGRLAGFHPVREALRRRPAAVRRVLIESSRTGQKRRELESLCAAAGVRVELVDSATLGRFAVGVHNGFAAEVSEQGAPRVDGGGDIELVVLAEDVQDPRNLGALLRVCEGAGVGQVLIRDHGAARLTDVAIKASAGASEWIDTERIGSSAQALDRLKAEGFWVYGLEGGGVPPWEIDLTGKVVFCVGGEEKGLRRLTRERCDGFVGLPMAGRVASLNLTTAAAAVLYEAHRQRTASRKVSLSPPARSG